jgi:hypothetical protein
LKNEIEKRQKESSPEANDVVKVNDKELIKEETVAKASAIQS